MTQVEIARQQIGRVSVSCTCNKRFPCQPETYGVDRVSGHTYKWALFNRDKEKCIIFQYTFAGLGEVIVNGKRHLVPAGKAFLVSSPSSVIYMQSPDDEFYHFIDVNIRGEAAQEIVQKITDKCGAVLTISPDSQALEMLCEHYNQLLAVHSIEDIYEDAAWGYKFLLTLLREQEPNMSYVQEKMPVCLEKALAFMEQNLENSMLDLKSLAGQTNLSVFYFTRLFTKYFGCSPRKYLLAQRLFRAAQLLAQDCSIPFKSIIAQCGFNSVPYFCRAFQKAYHISPGKYRSLYKYHSDD